MIVRQTFHSRSREDTLVFAGRIAGHIMPGNVVLLYGDLGAGKTTLIQGFCSHFQVKEQVSSPSFSIIQEYSGSCPVYHFDFFRITDPAEIADLGVEKYFTPDSVCFIEWPQIAEPFLPENRICIRIDTVYDAAVLEPQERIIYLDTAAAPEQDRA